MEMIVGRMAKLEVDLLLVGGSVCYTAKEKLLKRGIALAVGVKARVLDRISRCTNTPVLLSPAQVLGATPGTCGRWRVENVTIAAPPPAAAAAGSAAAGSAAAASAVTHVGGGSMGGCGYGAGGGSSVAASAAGSSAAMPPAPHPSRRVTLMYFEQCPAELLATVVLRGEGEEQMKDLKHMLAASAYIAADLAAEASYILDFGGTTALPAASAELTLTASGSVAAAGDAARTASHSGGGVAIEDGSGGGGGGTAAITDVSDPDSARRPKSLRHSLRQAVPQTVAVASGLPGGVSVEDVLGSPTAPQSANAFGFGAASAAGAGASAPDAAEAANDAHAPAPSLATASLAGATAASGSSGVSRYANSASAAVGETLPLSFPNPASAAFSRREAAEECFLTADGLTIDPPAAAPAAPHVLDRFSNLTNSNYVSSGRQIFDRDGAARDGAASSASSGASGGLVKSVKGAGGVHGGVVVAGGNGMAGGGGVCVVCEEQPADRLWSEEARTLRVATCWKRWDVLEAPCLMPRERSLHYSVEVAGAAESNPEDTESLGQFLHSHCFNLRRQCANQKCRESVTRHEQVFSHHGTRRQNRIRDPEVGRHVMYILKGYVHPRLPRPRLFTPSPFTPSPLHALAPIS